MEELKKRIKELRGELNDMLNDLDGCDRAKLLELSQELNGLISQYMMESQGRSSTCDPHEKAREISNMPGQARD